MGFVSKPEKLGGELAERLVGGERLSASQRLAELRRVVAAGTDEEFRRRCSLGELRAGRLTILVDDPSAAAVMRENWLLPLSGLLKRRSSGARVSSICFQVGRSELALDGRKIFPGHPEQDFCQLFIKHRP